MAQDILIVDDEVDIRELIQGILSDEGYNPRVAANGVEAIESIKARQPNLVILDVWLGESERDGLKILDLIKKDHSGVPVVMISGHATVEMAVSAMKKGAYDFIEKPFQYDRLLLVIERAIEAARLRQENQELKVKARIQPCLVGNSPALVQIRQMVQKVALTESRVFIKGPPGADKEGIAREIHTLSKRSHLPFMAVNCAGIQETRLEIELFGADIEGLPPGAPRKIGILEKAHGGTVFFEEITQLPLMIQAKLINTLGQNSFYRVGGSQKIDINVRFLASSSSEDMVSLIEKDQFKADLYYRLSVTTLEIPPLGERLADIPLIIEFLMEQAAASKKISPRQFSQEAIVLLQSYDWPGDLRQLMNMIDWVLLMSPGDSRRPIESYELPAEIITGNCFVNNQQHKEANVVALPLREAREVFERDYLLAQVRRFSGNISQTARFIGMERSALHRKLRTLGVNDTPVKDYSEAGVLEENQD